jgi:acetyl esterase/lipase
LRAGSLSGLPPTHIHTAQFDPMRDEGRAYAERLQQSGVEVQYTCHEGMIHLFYALTGLIPSAIPALRHIAAQVAPALASPPRPGPPSAAC